MYTESQYFTLTVTVYYTQSFNLQNIAVHVMHCFIWYTGMEYMIVRNLFGQKISYVKETHIIITLNH